MNNSARIVLAPVGTLGELNPFIAVGLALQARGCDVCIAAAEEYRLRVESLGLAFHAVRPSREQILKDMGLSEGEVLRQAAQGNAAAFVLENIIAPYLTESYSDLNEATQGAALVMTSSLAVVARMTAAKMRLATVSLLLSPVAFLSADEPAYLMEFPWLPTIRRLFGARAIVLLFVLSSRYLRRRGERIAAFHKSLGLPPARFDEVFGEALFADWVVGLYSPCMGAIPRDTPGHGEIAGFAFLDDEPAMAPGPAQSLADFLAAGPAPLVFTLGSILANSEAEFYRQAVDAARLSGMRAILLVGDDAEVKLRHLSSSDILVLGYASHALVFPHAAIIVHHGGMGTVGQALRAGRPQLICPLMSDQGDNAERLVRLGVARRLNLRRFTAARAATAIAILLRGGPSVKAAVLARQVAAEKGATFVADRVLALLER